MALFDRTVSLRLPGVTRDVGGAITFRGGKGPRIEFDFVRSIRAEPDQGTIRVWNLPAKVADLLVSDQETFSSNLQQVQTVRVDDATRAKRLHTLLEDHIVEIWAGYGDNAQPMFRGDMVAVRPRIRVGQDIVTEIDVGDGFVALQEQWLAQSFGVGETPANLLAFFGALVDVDGDPDKIKAAISLIAPNAITANLANGVVATGRPADAIKEIADFLGLYWWVRDGKIEFLPRTSFLPDFAVVLDARSTLISTDLTDDGRYRRFQCVLAPAVHPGRAVLIRDRDGAEFRGRILETQVTADTHGSVWSISGLCDASEWLGVPEVTLTAFGAASSTTVRAFDISSLL